MSCRHGEGRGEGKKRKTILTSPKREDSIPNHSIQRRGKEVSVFLSFFGGRKRLKALAYCIDQGGRERKGRRDQPGA